MIHQARFLTLAVVVLMLALPTTLLAGKNNKTANGRNGAQPARVLKRYDANHNGSIDGDEAAALRKAFDAFKGLDKDGNGTLDDSEIASIKADGNGRAKAAKGERKRKKNA